MKEERCPRTRSPFAGGDCGGRRGELWSREVECSHRGAEGRAERFCTEARRRAALTSARGLSAPPPGPAGLGAEARAAVGSQGEDWGWLREHSLKGLVHHGEPGRSPGKVCSCRRGKRLFLTFLFPGARGEGIQSAA